MNNRNARFAIAVHILAYLSLNGGGPITSDVIAQSVKTHPTFIRRFFSRLARAGLTRGQYGNLGGALLAREATAITLAEAYRAVNEDGDAFVVDRETDQTCLVGRNISAALSGPLREVENDMLARLGRVTIADIAKQVLHQETLRRPGRKGRR